MNAKKKTIINFVISVFTQAIILILGLVIPRIVLTNYGSDTNGLTSTIGQIFTYMALLEAGVSVSARNAFYKPIHENDRNGISFVASLAKRYYRKITLVYFVIIVISSFALPFLLKTSISYFTIVLYIFFEGLSSVISFYFVNTWTTFLRAIGENYVINIVELIIKLLSYGVKIVLSLFGLNIALIQVGFFVVSLLQLIIYRLYMKNKYSWIDYNLETGNNKLPDKNANLVSEIAWTVFSSTDMIILSIFVSTSASSVYSIYNMVFIALNGLLNAAYQSVNYHLGQAYNRGNKMEYCKIHDLYNSVFIGTVCALMSVSYFLILPFVKIYTYGVDDINYIHKYLPVLFCMVHILSWSRYISGNLIGISFRQKQAVKVNVAEVLLNLILSLIFVQFWGIEGVLLATVVALPLKVIYCSYVSDIKILQRKPFKTIKIIGANYLAFGLSIFINYFFNIQIDNYLVFIIYGFVLSAVFFLIYFCLNLVVNKDVLKILKIIRR